MSHSFFVGRASISNQRAQVYGYLGTPYSDRCVDFLDSHNRQRPERGIFTRSHGVMYLCDCRKWPDSEYAVNAPHIVIDGHAGLMYNKVQPLFLFIIIVV